MHGSILGAVHNPDMCDSKEEIAEVTASLVVEYGRKFAGVDL